MLYGLLGGKILCIFKKLFELLFFLVYNEIIVMNGYMDYIYIEKNVLIDLFFLNFVSIE